MKNTDINEYTGSGDGSPAFDDASDEVKTKRRSIRISYLVLFLIIGLMPVVKGCNGVVTLSSVDVMIFNVPQGAVENERFAPYFILAFLALWTSAVMLFLALRKGEVIQPESKFLWIGGAALGIYLIVTMVFASSYGRMISIEFGWFMSLLIAVLFVFHPKLEPLILRQLLRQTDLAGGRTDTSDVTVTQQKPSPVLQGGGSAASKDDSIQPASTAEDSVPDPEEIYHYSVEGRQPKQMTMTEIRGELKKAPDRRHLVWKEGWSDWKKAQDVFPAVSEVPSSADGREGAEPIPPPAADSSSAARTETERSGHMTAASTTTDVDASARGGSRNLLIGAGAFVVLVGLVLIFALQGGDKTDALVGHYTYETSGVSATLDIKRNDAGIFFIEGLSLYGTNREYGPNIGTLGIVAEFKDGMLVGTDDPDYRITIRPTDDGIVVEETGSNENFGFNVNFAGTYLRSDVSAADEEAATSDAGDAAASEQMDDGSLPTEFETMVRDGTLFSYAYDDLEIESEKLPDGWYEFWIYLMNQEPYGGDPQIASRVGTYRYHPASGELMIHDVVTDSYAPWTVEDRISLGDEYGDGSGLSTMERNAIEDFVYAFVRAQNQNDLDALMKFYADEVDYYSWGTAPRKRIREDKEAYFKRWSVRDYTIQSGDITITSSDMAGVYYVSYGLDYAVESPARDAESSGLAYASLTIQTKSPDGDPDSGLLITKERSE